MGEVTKEGAIKETSWRDYPIYTERREEFFDAPQAIVAGGFAGLCVDTFLYPLDTLKTRLQAKEGFRLAGGFKRIYAGLPSVLVGSAPGAALFFVSYEASRSLLNKFAFFHERHWLKDATSASLGEVMACLIRVPTEVVKQRAQAEAWRRRRPTQIFWDTYHAEGIRGMYRGYHAMIIREIPFSFIQFPIWEWMKREVRSKTGKSATPFEGAVCGSISGGIAAALTTPFDVAKTRIILAQKVHKQELRLLPVLSDVAKTEGVRGLFAGIVPRVLWMTIGGFVFFGAYEFGRILGALATNGPTEDSYVNAGMVNFQFRFRETVDNWVDWLIVDDIMEWKGHPRTFGQTREMAREFEEEREKLKDKPRGMFLTGRS